MAIPELPPVEEQFTADASRYLAALEAMAAAVRPVLDMQERLAAALAATQAYMDDAAGAAVQMAGADSRVADAMSGAARAAEEAAVAAAQAAAAQRDQAGSAGTAAAAEQAAAEAAGNAARANAELAASAFNADAFQRALVSSLRTEIASAAASASATRALASAQEALAAAEAEAADGAERLAEAEAAGSLAAYQDAQAAKVFAEADAVAAAAASEAADAVSKGNAAYAAGIVAMGGYDAAAKLTATANTATTATANTAANSYRVLGTGIRLTGTAIHWLISGTLEFLAVAIPAAIAFGDAMLVAAQGAQMVDEHMTALWTAAEATGNQLHITAGQALGFGDALQQAQDKANGQVYQALGGTLDALGGKFSTFAAGADTSLSRVKSGFGSFAAAGNQVLGEMDTLVAHIQYDLVTGAGGATSQLLSHMVSDLTELGQVAGNVGHAILNFASDMPGLAEVLLRVIDGISQFVEWLSRAPSWLIATAMGLEEFYRWGGLAASALTLLGRAAIGLIPAIGSGLLAVFGTLGTVMVSVARFSGYLVSGFGSIVSATGNLIPGLTKTGAAIEQVGAEMTYVERTATWSWVGLGIAALAGLAIGLDKVRNATQQFIDSTNKAIAAASNLTVLNTISSGLAQATAQIAQQTTILNSYSGAAQAAGKATGGFITWLEQVAGPAGGAAQGFLNLATSNKGWVRDAVNAIPIVGSYIEILAGWSGGASEAASKIDQLRVQQQKWEQDAVHVSQGAALISRQFGTDFTGSLELATQAGVNLTAGITGMSQAAVINRIKIADLVSGYTAMGQNSSAISSDMEVLAIQSGLAATKVQQLTQAMQQYDQQLVGGTGDTAAYAAALGTIGNISTTVAGKTTTASLSASKFATELAQGPVRASQAWTNFDQVAGSTLPSLIGWFQTAGAEGLLSGTKMHQGILDALSGLTAYAAKSPAAQAEILGVARAAGINVTSWSQLQTQLSGAHAKLSGLNPIVSSVTGQMANLAKVAQNLGNVLSSDITSTMDTAKVAASGLYTASFALAKALMQPTTPAATLHTDLQNLYSVQLKLTSSKSDAQAYVQAFADGYGKVGTAAYNSWVKQNAAATAGTGQLKNTVQAAGGTLRTYGEALGTDTFAGFQSFNLGDKMSADAHQSVQALITSLSSSGGALQTSAQDLGTKAYAGFQAANLGTKLSTSAHQAVTGMANSVTASSGQAVSATTNMTNQMGAKAAALAGPMRAAGAGASEGLAAGILAGEGAAVAAAQQVASATAAALAAGLKVHSPSTLTYQYGLWLLEGMANGMFAGLPLMEGAVRAMMAMMAFGRAASQTPSLLSTPAVSGYSHAPLVPSAAGGGGGGGGQALTVNVYPQGHVLTDMQLADLIRDVVQQYIPRNPDNGFQRQGRPG